MPEKAININLLPKEDLDPRTINKFLRWALTYGRYIVVGTELIVILAFLSRFKLDRDATDLQEAIDQKQAIIEATADLEKEIRFLQNRLATVKYISSYSVSQTGIFESFSQSLSQDVSIDSLSITGRKIDATGFTFSETGLASTINALVASGKWVDISINDLSRPKKGMGLSFTLSALYVSD